MIQRRQFLSAATLGTAAMVVPNPLGLLAHPATGLARPEPTTDLKWQCQIIETLASGRDFRRPVVTGVSLQPGGTLISIVGDNHRVGIYNTIDNRFDTNLEQHSDWVRTSQFSPNGQQLATAGNDRTLLLWNTNDWTEPTHRLRHPEAIINAKFSPDGRRLATVGFEPLLRIYDAQTAEVATQFRCACNDNHAVAFSRDGSEIAAAGRCGNIRVWNLNTGQQVGQFKIHRNRIRSLEYLVDGRILSAGDDQLIKITDPRNANQVVSFPRQACKLYAIQTLDGGILATAGSDNEIRIWQLNDQSLIGSLKGHTGTVSCLDFADSRLVSGSYDTHARLWSTEQYTSAPEGRQTQNPTGFNNPAGWNPVLK